MKHTMAYTISEEPNQDEIVLTKRLLLVKMIHRLPGGTNFHEDGSLGSLLQGQGAEAVFGKLQSRATDLATKRQ